MATSVQQSFHPTLSNETGITNFNEQTYSFFRRIPKHNVLIIKEDMDFITG